MTQLLQREAIQFDALSSLLKSADLHVLEAGEVITVSDDSDEPPFTHFFRLNYVIKGHIHLYRGNTNYKVTEGHLLFLLPDQKISVHEDGEETHILFINFEVRNLDKRDAFVKGIEKSFPSHIIEDRANVIYEIFRLILQETNIRQPGYALSINNLFTHMLVQVSRLKANTVYEDELMTKANHSISLYNEAVSYIGRHISESIRIPDIASHLFISEIYLYKLFTEHAGCSPKEYITKYRIMLAKGYLQNSGSTIKNISDSLGYPDPNYFSAVFKKATGMSPLEYRKNNSKK